jgi:hypothetical protein
VYRTAYSKLQWNVKNGLYSRYITRKNAYKSVTQFVQVSGKFLYDVYQTTSSIVLGILERPMIVVSRNLYSHGKSTVYCLHSGVLLGDKQMARQEFLNSCTVIMIGDFT